MKDKNSSAIENSLKNFIKDEAQKVVVLKGEWGVGKTRFWKDFFQKEKEKEKNNILKKQFKAYSYASLFGVKDIQDLKRQVLTNFEMLNDEGMNSHLEKLKPLSKILEHITPANINLSTGVDSLAENWLLDEFLICIDDLERKEETISVSSILGFISWLKEEKNCKVLLIYNDEKIDGDFKKELKEYQEKVIDLSLAYKPAIEENLSLVWKDGAPKDVQQIFSILEVNNIRVMQKVKWVQDYFSKELKNYKYLRNITIYNSAILTLIYFTFSENISIYSVINSSFFLPKLRPHVDSQPEDIQNHIFTEQLQKKLLHLRYGSTKFDRAIIDFLENGFVDFELYKEILDNEEIFKEQNQLKLDFYKLRDGFRSNFLITREKIVGELNQFVESHNNSIYLELAIEISKFLIYLGEKDSAFKLVYSSADSFIQNYERLILPENEARWMGLVEEFEEVYHYILKALLDKNTSKKYLPLKILNQLKDEQKSPSEWIFFLKNYSEEEIYKWLIEETDPNLGSLLDAFLKRFESPKSKIEMEQYKKVRSCLEKMKADGFNFYLLDVLGFG